MSRFDLENDEAVWAAYRRYDKAAVTEKLLRRCLDRVARPQSLEPSTRSRLTCSCLPRLGDVRPTPREIHHDTFLRKRSTNAKRSFYAKG